MNEQKVLFWNFDDLLASSIHIGAEVRDLSFSVNFSVWIICATVASQSVDNFRKI